MGVFWGPSHEGNLFSNPTVLVQNKAHPFVFKYQSQKLSYKIFFFQKMAKQKTKASHIVWEPDKQA